MAIRYKMQRIREDAFLPLKNMKLKMETDLFILYHKKISLSYSDVIKAITHPKYNENYVQVDLKKLAEMARRRRRTW